MYTTEQRLEIYKRLLREALSPSMIEWSNGVVPSTHFGFCFMISSVIDTSLPYEKIDKIFPELWAKRTNPKAIFNMWNNWDERINSLTEVIKEMEAPCILQNND